MTPTQKNYENIAATVIKKMAVRQIEGYYCPDKEAALKKALELIPEGASVGWGGSVTMSEIGLIDAAGRFEFPAQRQIRTPVAGENHNPARLHVEPVHHPGPLRGTDALHFRIAPHQLVAERFDLGHAATAADDEPIGDDGLVCNLDGPYIQGLFVV